MDFGHKVYKTYFDIDLADEIVKDEGKFDIVVFTNVFAHIDDLCNLLTATKKVLKKNGMLVIENHYLGSVLNKNQFDTFYHEHPRTYSALSFSYIAKSLDLTISKLEFTSRYGGNIRVFLSNKVIKNENDLVNIFQNEQDTFKQLFIKLNHSVDTWKYETSLKLDNLIKLNGPLVAKAFPGRAAILIHLLKYNEANIKAVYEKPGSLKIDHYVPGTKIPIKCEKEFFNNKAEHKQILNLAWHLSDEIKRYMKDKNYLGKVINILE